MNTQFTAGPWTVDQDAVCNANQHIAFAIGPDTASYAEQKANAQRIVACVNACAGIPTEVLCSKNSRGQDYIFGLSQDASQAEVDCDALRAVNAELVAALQYIVELSQREEIAAHQNNSSLSSLERNCKNLAIAALAKAGA